jgi:hypothetical protein
MKNLCVWLAVVVLLGQAARAQAQEEQGLDSTAKRAPAIESALQNLDLQPAPPATAAPTADANNPTAGSDTPSAVGPEQGNASPETAPAPAGPIGPARQPLAYPGPVAGPGVDGYSSGCCGHCGIGHCWQRLHDWLNYCPKKSPHCGTCCRPCCPPPLYVYFLENCSRGQIPRLPDVIPQAPTTPEEVATTPASVEPSPVAQTSAETPATEATSETPADVPAATPPPNGPPVEGAADGQP